MESALWEAAGVPTVVCGPADGGMHAADEWVDLAQLRPELALSRARPRLYHVREKNGRREIDLLIEMGAHRVVALEVKATAAPATDDARHLAWLRDELGDRFVAGAILHTGPGRFRLSPRIFAVPIASIWGPR
jgi:predicted AAA+ superfamily ATPase